MFTTREQILTHAAGVTLHSHPYSMTYPRYDCSVFVTECLGVPNPLDWDTVNMVTADLVVPIDSSSAQPGDVWGLMGPGTAGADGHTALILGTPRTRPDGQWAIMEQTGPDGHMGPSINLYPAVPDGYQTYKSAYIMGGLGDMRNDFVREANGSIWQLVGITYGKPVLVAVLVPWSTMAALGCTYTDVPAVDWSQAIQGPLPTTTGGPTGGPTADDVAARMATILAPQVTDALKAWFTRS